MKLIFQWRFNEPFAIFFERNPYEAPNVMWDFQLGWLQIYCEEVTK